MYCRKCGKQIHDDSISCEYCGHQIEELNEYIVKENDQTVEILSAETVNEITENISNDSMILSQNADCNKFSMKWFDFLVKFWLPVSLVLGIILDTVNLIKMFGLYSDIFSFFSVKLYFILLLLYIIPVKIFHLLAYINLRSYKKAGYKMLLAIIILYGINKMMGYICTIPFAIEIGSFDIIRKGLFQSFISSLIFTPTIFMLNYIYFNKRKAIFR